MLYYTLAAIPRLLGFTTANFVFLVIRGATIHVWSGPPRPIAGGNYEPAEDLPIEGLDLSAGEVVVLPSSIVAAIDTMKGL